jgi:hypothetical protein
LGAFSPIWAGFLKIKEIANNFCYFFQSFLIKNGLGYILRNFLQAPLLLIGLKLQTLVTFTFCIFVILII